MFCPFFSILTAQIYKGIGVALQSRLAPFIANPDLVTELQPRAIRVLSVPEYYAEYRETGNGYAAFLGSSIAAKVRLTSAFSARIYVWNRSYLLTRMGKTMFPRQIIRSRGRIPSSR